MVLRPDPATFAILPWTIDRARRKRGCCATSRCPTERRSKAARARTLKRVVDDCRDVLREVKTSLEVEFYLFQREPDGTPTTRTRRRRFVLRLLAERPRRRVADRDGRRARVDGHPRVERAPRARRRAARTRYGRRVRSSATRRPRSSPCAASSSKSRPATTSTRRSCPSPSKRRPATDCTSTSSSATSTRRCACTRSADCSTTRRGSRRSAIRPSTPTSAWSRLGTRRSSRSGRSAARMRWCACRHRSTGTPLIEVRSPDAACNPYLAHGGADRSGRRRDSLAHAAGRSVHRVDLRPSRQLSAKNTASARFPGSLGEAIEALDADP